MADHTTFDTSHRKLIDRGVATRDVVDAALGRLACVCRLGPMQVLLERSFDLGIVGLTHGRHPLSFAGMGAARRLRFRVAMRLSVESLVAIESFVAHEKLVLSFGSAGWPEDRPAFPFQAIFLV